jgi:hypothetical protein
VLGGVRAGIHELIPIIVLTGVGVALTFAVVGYMLGLWGHLGERNTEILRLGVDSAVTYCVLDNGSRVPVVAVQFVNPGLRDTFVYRVDVLGYGWFYVRYSVDYWGPPSGCVNVTLVEVGEKGLLLRHGASGWFYVVLTERIASRLHSGVYVGIRVYTRFGALFLGHVPVRLGRP